MRKRVRIRRRQALEEPEVIVIPMIDVMMFLLFFFMVASLAMVTQNAIPVALPKASTSQNENAESITITVRADGTIFLNTTETPMESLEAALEKLKVGPKNVITINADEKVAHGVVIDVMDEARKAGVVAFGFATRK